MYQENTWMIGDSSAIPAPASWTRQENKLFEQALVIFPDETPDRWRRIAERLPGKTPWEVREHYEALVHDVQVIDSGGVELPCYSDDSFTPSWDSPECGTDNQISFGSKPKRGETERKKGIPWTEEEHKRFLKGLKIYGKGDWRSISRNSVVSRTPTQVASHAQKYYQRLNSKKKDKKRSSIHDITTVESQAVPVAQPQTASSTPQQQQQQQQQQQHQQQPPPPPWVGPSSGFVVQQGMEPVGLPRNSMVVPPMAQPQTPNNRQLPQQQQQHLVGPSGLQRPPPPREGYGYEQFGFPM